MTIALEQSHGFRASRRNFIEASHETGILEGLIALIGALLHHGVAEKFVIAEQIRGGLLVIVGSPAAVVVREIGFRGVGKIVGGESYVVIQLNQIVGIGKIVVVVIAAVVSVSAAVSPVTRICFR